MVPRLAVPVFAFMSGLAIDVSGIESPELAIGLWSFGVAWLLAAYGWRPLRHRIAQYEVQSPVRRRRTATNLPIPPLTKLPAWATESRVGLPSTVTPHFLITEMLDKTDVAAQRAIQPYLGKWLTVTGIVDDVSVIGGTHRLWIQIDGPPLPSKGIALRISGALMFGKKWDSHLEVMPKGTPIRAAGKLVGVAPDLGGTITLDDCDLLDA